MKACSISEASGFFRTFKTAPETVPSFPACNIWSKTALKVMKAYMDIASW